MDNCIFINHRLVRQGKITELIVTWSNGRIGATVTRKSLTIKRIYGRIGKGDVTLSLPRLVAFDTLCAEWADIRNSWAAYFGSSAGYPAGCAGAWYFQPAGIATKPTKVGVQHFGHVDEGERFTGTEDERDVEKTLAENSLFVHTKNVYRVGEKWGNSNGELVGAVYEIPDEIRIEARRHELKICTQTGWTSIESDTGWSSAEAGSEIIFIHELILLMQSEQAAW